MRLNAFENESSIWSEYNANRYVDEAVPCIKLKPKEQQTSLGNLCFKVTPLPCDTFAEVLLCKCPLYVGIIFFIMKYALIKYMKPDFPYYIYTVC